MAMRRDRPAVVAGFGGYPALPALIAAGLLKVPRLIHEQNGVLGRVNRRFAPKVEAVACGSWPTALPEGTRGLHVGNPVRTAVLGAARRALHRARRLADGARGDRRQPGRRLLRPAGARGDAAPRARAARAAAAQPAGAARGHGPGARRLRGPGHGARPARLLRRRPRAAGRGQPRDQPRRRELDRRHRGDRPAGDPRALPARHRRPSGGERARAGRGRRRLHAPRGRR